MVMNIDDETINCRFGDYANKVNDYLLVETKKDDLIKIFNDHNSLYNLNNAR